MSSKSWCRRCGRRCSVMLDLCPHARPLPLAAAPPPALPPHAWAALQIYLAGRGRGVQREAVDPPSSKAQAPSQTRAGGGAAARSPPRTNTKRRTPRTEHPEANGLTDTLGGDFAYLPDPGPDDRLHPRQRLPMDPAPPRYLPLPARAKKDYVDLQLKNGAVELVVTTRRLGLMATGGPLTRLRGQRGLDRQSADSCCRRAVSLRLAPRMEAVL